LDDISGSSESALQGALFDFVETVIYPPRTASLNEMKKGFDIVPLSQHLLSFTHNRLKEYFVGVEAVTTAEVIQALIFTEGLPDHVQVNS